MFVDNSTLSEVLIGYPDLHGGYLHLWISRRNGLRLFICQGVQPNSLTADSVLLTSICTPLFRYKCFYSTLCLTTNCQQYENPIYCTLPYIWIFYLVEPKILGRTGVSWGASKENFLDLLDSFRNHPSHRIIVGLSPWVWSWRREKSSKMLCYKLPSAKVNCEPVPTTNHHLHYHHFNASPAWLVRDMERAGLGLGPPPA